MMRIYLLELCVLLAGASELQLRVDTRTGAFNISYGGSLWLSGGEYRVGRLSSSAGSLALRGVAHSQGRDSLGDYAATTLSWASSQSQDGEVLMSTSFREYASDRGALVFEQEFPSKVDLTLTNDTSLAAGTVFPGFLRKSGTPDLPCFAYHGLFPALRPCTLSSYAETWEGGVPLVIYKTEKNLPMVVFSPLDNAMAHHMAHGPDFFGAGVKATAQEIPAGWRQRFLLSAGEGVNAGMMAWGDRMLRFNGKPRVDNRYRDKVHGTIGFWTDNGGYYHYSIGNSSLGSTYEEVLPKVKAYHDSIGVPFGHWQFDSWFYPKDGKVNPGGGGSAVTNWTALPSVFPHGMAYIQSKLKVPMVMHNRQWSEHSDYMHNWTDIEWYTAGSAAIPKDPVKFFKRFFTQQKGWGLSMYEQDWMNLEYEKSKALQRNLTLADLWLRGMAVGAAGGNLTVQYCMPLPNEVLAAAGFPEVTNARATGDYLHGKDQWAIGSTAIFYWALGILPFKDGFYSSSLKQTGGQTEGPETHPDREALMATLSAAMVGPMDGIYLLNKSRVMATCRKDGLVLKPDRPLTTPDACFLRRQPLCQVYETHSDVSGLGRVHYYFNNDGAAPLLAEEVYADLTQQHVVYNWYTGTLALLTASNKLEAGYEGHTYALVTPVQMGWAFIGEVATYVSASSARFPAVAVEPDRLHARVRRAPGESVRVCVARVPTLKMICQVVTSGIEEDAFLVFMAWEWEEAAAPRQEELIV